MYTFFIRRYINNLSIEQFERLAKEHQIMFNQEELQFCYFLVKNQWMDFYQGDRDAFFKQIKLKVRSEVFDQIMNVYHQYEDKIR